MLVSNKSTVFLVAQIVAMAVNTSMLYTCLRSRQTIIEQDPLSILVQRLHGWFSVGYSYVDYWVPSDYAYMLYMLDSQLEQRPFDDYIV